MDPVSAIGLAGSIVGIIEVAARTVSTLRALQQRWKTADLTISLLISQMTTLKAALSQIEDWISTSLSLIQHHQLVMDLEASLESCETLLLFIDGQMSLFELNDSNALFLESKIKAVLQDNTVKECATHLAHQSTALNLLLTVLSCRSMSEQITLLQAKKTRRVLDQVEVDSSSLFCLRDSASFHSSLSATTARSSLLDISFDFDQELTATKVYHRQWRPLIRGALNRARRAKESPVESHRAVAVRILALGQAGSRTCKLLQVMSILCEGHYDPELRRGYIYQIVLSATTATLDKMTEQSLALENLETETHLQSILCQHTSINNDNMSETLGKALISVWDDRGMKRCYHENIEGSAHPSTTYFLDSILRIASAGYVPSFEDAAKSLIDRTGHSECLTLPVTLCSRRYNFVRLVPLGASLKTPPEASVKNMADECEDLNAVLFIVDLAVYNTYSTDGSLEQDGDDTLERFRRHCKLPWLAEKDIILVFLNLKKLSNKALNVHTPRHRNRENHMRKADDIVERFVSLNKGDYRQIYVIFADNDNRAKNLDCLENAMKQIMSKGAIPFEQ